MIVSTLAVAAAVSVLEAVATIIIQIRTVRKPRRMRYIISVFSLLTLPPSLINVLCYANAVSDHWNSFCYLICTLFMLALHFWLNLDIGRQIRIKGIQYSHPLIVVGSITLVGAMMCMMAQLIILLVRQESFTIKWVFIVGVCLSIVCDGLTFFYAFSSLIALKDQRIHANQSKTTAIGAWYLIIQFVWYMLYGVLYVWFFTKSWDFFFSLLVLDYLMRFILCLMFMWAPPPFAIKYMTNQFFTIQSERSTSRLGYSHTESSFIYDEKPTNLNSSVAKDNNADPER